MKSIHASHRHKPEHVEALDALDARARKVAEEIRTAIIKATSTPEFEGGVRAAVAIIIDEAVANGDDAEEARKDVTFEREMNVNRGLICGILLHQFAYDAQAYPVPMFAVGAENAAEYIDAAEAAKTADPAKGA